MSNTSEVITANAGWSRLRYAIAGILFIAAGAKIINWVQILAGDGLLSDRSFLLGVIGLEAAIATFVSLGPTIASWRTSVLTFSVLALSAGYALVTGQNCNCIAETIRPEFMLALDVSVVLLAIWFRPPVPPASADRQLILNLGGCLAVGIIFVAVALFMERSAVQQIADLDSPLEFVIADMLIDKAWPITARYHPDLEALQTGKWLVIIVRRDCEHCRELLLEFFSSPHRHRQNERTAVFLAGESHWHFQFDKVSMAPEDCAVIHWIEEEPFVASPAIFLLSDGQVIAAADGEEANEFCRSLF